MQSWVYLADIYRVDTHHSAVPANMERDRLMCWKFAALFGSRGYARPSFSLVLECLRFASFFPLLKLFPDEPWSFCPFFSYLCFRIYRTPENMTGVVSIAPAHSDCDTKGSMPPSPLPWARTKWPLS